MEFTLFVDKTKVLVCAEYDHGIYVVLHKKPTLIKLGDMQIPCFNLEAEKKAYRKLNMFYNLFSILRIFLKKSNQTIDPFQHF